MTTKTRLARFARRKRRILFRVFAIPAVIGVSLGGIAAITLPSSKAPVVVNKKPRAAPWQAYEPLPASFWYVPQPTIPETVSTSLLDRPEIEGADRKPPKAAKGAGTTARGVSFPKMPKIP